MSNQHILIHYHIFKNAGSSVDANLQHSFGHRWGTFEGSHAHDIQSSMQLSAFMAANPHLVAISSHLARPPLPHPDCLPVVFLRHPMLRAYSVYQYTRIDSTQPYSNIAQELTFPSYIQWALRKETGSIVIRDYQVVHLSNASWRGGDILRTEADQFDFEQACHLLSDWGIVGIVEEFDLSASVFQARHGKYLPNLDFIPRMENAITSVTTPVAERLDQLLRMLGCDLHDEFMAANRLDMELYRHGQALLHKAAKDSHLAS